MYVKVTSVDDIKEDGIYPFVVGDFQIIIIRVGSDFFAFEDRCSHQDMPLSEGGEIDRDKYILTCGWHGATFSLRTGNNLSLPAFEPIRKFELKIEDGLIYVDVDED